VVQGSRQAGIYRVPPGRNYPEGAYEARSAMGMADPAADVPAGRHKVGPSDWLRVRAGHRQVLAIRRLASRRALAAAIAFTIRGPASWI
jgi:hypothetical protein